MSAYTAASRGDARRVLISCGEASGDLYAGALTRELRRQDPTISVAGFGGPQLAAAGAELLADYRRFAVTGLVEAIRVLPRSWRMLRLIEAAARESRPDVFVAIDFPDFNFRLLKPIHQMGIPIVYYISPQLWAWRAGRINQVRRYVSKMLVIFPFEVDVYERAGVPVEFVGHPLLELASATQPRERWRVAHGLDPSRPVLALLPGSRPNEVSRMLPVFVDALPRIAAAVPGVQFVVARAPSLSDDLFAQIQHSAVATIVEGETDDVLAAADAVVTASGTATVQTAIHGTPMVIVYRLSTLTYAMARRFVKVSTYGMVNLIAGRQIVPELIQDDCTPERVADAAVSILTDQPRIQTMRADIAAMRANLGGPGASERAARAVLSAVRR
ncbi:MAG: lipid-A-disaccharide synthase [Acidobacteriota bacterium]